MCKYCVLFIDVSINGPLCCFHLLVLVNSVVMNLGVEISYKDSLVIVLGIHTNQVVIVFNFLRHLHFFFLSVAVFNRSNSSVPLQQTVDEFEFFCFTYLYTRVCGTGWATGGCQLHFTLSHDC